MTEQELMQEALEWREHIAKLAADCSDQELFRKRLATFDWLIKQAERVEELEMQLSINTNNMKQLQNKIERYKQALEFYADPENYCVTFEDDYEPILKDNGKIARKALEGDD